MKPNSDLTFGLLGSVPTRQQGKLLSWTDFPRDGDGPRSNTRAKESATGRKLDRARLVRRKAFERCRLWGRVVYTSSAL